MVTIDAMMAGLRSRCGGQIPLVQWPGPARLLAVSDEGVTLLVAGRRTVLTWARVRSAVERLAANHELSIIELGGQQDAVALVALVAATQAEYVTVSEEHGVLRLKDARGTPVHQPTAPRDGAGRSETRAGQ